MGVSQRTTTGPEILRQLNGEIDQILRIPTQDAIDAAQQIGAEEGLLMGISSGANVLAAVQVAQELGPGTTW